MNIEDSKAGILVEEAKSKSKIEEFKTKNSKIILLKEMFDKAKDSLTKEERKNYLDKLLEI